MARPECFVSRWKVQTKVWTPENTRGAPLRDQRRRSRFSGFTRPSRRRGTRPSWGAPRLSIGATNTARTRAPPTKHDVSARSRFEGMAPEQRVSQKARSRRRLETCKGGSAFREADRASQHPLCPRSRRTKGEQKRRASVASVPSSLKSRSVCKAGRFCRSRPNNGPAMAGA
jgi:hypothetical protein